jgi:hypothetical protein
MLTLTSPRWADLNHAYGPAGDIPDLLVRAAVEPRPGHHPESAWFALWSALCHEGDVYTASYAAVPHLVPLVAAQLAARRYDALLLAASIELARFEGTGPALPGDLAEAYKAAVGRGRDLVAGTQPWDADSQVAIEGSAAAFRGDAAAARAIFDADLEEEADDDLAGPA